MKTAELSILIAARNEGSELLRTVASCQKACADVDHEIIVVDDGSTDRSGETLAQKYPQVQLLRNGEPTGTSAPKSQAAEHAAGKTLLFLDAHCRLDPDALQHLLKGIAMTDAQAILVPRVAALDPHSWEVHSGMLHGLARLNLRSFDFEGVRKRALPSRPPFLETSALAGICCAMRRTLYDALGGFDPGAPGRALEDVDLGLRAWLWGSAVLCDPEANPSHASSSVRSRR